MLYNQEWDKTKIVSAKTNVLSMAGFIEWLEQQPHAGEYSFTDLDNCVMTQYFRSHNRMVSYTTIKHVLYGWKYWTLWTRRLPDGFYEVALYGQHTYGAALERARAFAAEDR